jgi:hypothetical protein
MEPDTRVDVIVAYDDGTCKIVSDIRYDEISVRVGFIPITSDWIVKVVISRR